MTAENWGTERSLEGVVFRTKGEFSTLVECNICGAKFDHKALFIAHNGMTHYDVPKEQQTMWPDEADPSVLEAQPPNRAKKAKGISTKTISDEKKTMKKANKANENSTKTITDKLLHRSLEGVVFRTKGEFSTLVECNICGAKFDHEAFFIAHNGMTHYDVPKEQQTLWPDETNPRPSTMPRKPLKRAKKGKEISNKKPLDDRPHKCHICTKAFKWRSNLSKHVKLHSGERLHLCSFCGKTYKLIEHLENHLLVHTGERPFKCTHCKQTFNRKSSWKEHLKSHSGARLFKCNHCDKSFTRKVNLTRHVKLHTGELPYKCKICPEAFSRSDTLKLHELAHADNQHSASGKQPTGQRPIRTKADSV